ncbi:hypothetical protein U0C82_12365 [Fulvimarina sp. 2208YS6-2-32]|uniref:Phasin protein n=1 Tax=Fulvimarina uroteuthidis TaxID=3098149 RepID=A0ABU5I4A9_9HYPH|nr:hypothetical protein [Fulvimarina sp. 2208YS6-2-32]MDY8109932.1 hypothetical protein [Fulvimarina sp. 2208YS6-2-32]
MRDQDDIEPFDAPTAALRDGSDGSDGSEPGLDPVTSLSSLMTLCQLTPFVLAARIPMLISETGIYSPLEREETRLAMSEKVDAVVEGTIAFQAQWTASVLALQAATLEGRFAIADYFGGFGDLTASALKPVLDRLQSNADRLG